jgi:hypothetical protein
MAAAGKFKAYDFFKQNVANGLIDLDSHTFKLALFLSTSNANTLGVGTGLLADLTNQHANANGYLTGGVALTGVTWVRAAGTLTFDAADLSPAWTAAGGPITARFAVIYDDTAVGDPLVCVCLLDATPADVTATDGNPFNVVFNASGIFTLSGMTVD